MRKIRVKNYDYVCIGEYPFHKELKEELLPLLENYPDEMGRKTRVKATMPKYQWDPKSDRLERLKNILLESASSNFTFRWSDGVDAQYFMKHLFFLVSSIYL